MAKSERSGHTTTDHDFIRQWVEERGGWPARVKGTGGKNDPGMIRVDFPGFSGEGSLEQIEWEEWFQSFDDNGLAFLHRDMSHGAGDLDRFNKLVSRSSSDDTQSEPRGRRTRSAVASSARSRGGATTTRKSTTSRATKSTAKSGASDSGSKSGGSRSTTRASSSSKTTGETASKSSRSSSGGSKTTAASRSTSARSSSGTSKSSGASKSNGTSKSSNGTRSRKQDSESDTGATELRELLKHELGDLLFAERVFLKGTRTMAREAQDPQVKARLEEHVTETERQIERLNDAFKAIGEKAKAEECPAALGLKEEHDSYKSEEKPSKELLSAFDLGSGLRVEHYEIAAYRTTIAVANALGEKECAAILKENLQEEMAMASFLEKNAPLALRKMALGEKAGGMIRKVRDAVGV